MKFDSAQLRQGWERPEKLRPIVIIGAGDIVRDAHLPAYGKAGFPVAGLYDLDRRVAEARAREFGVARVYGTMAEATATPEVVYDVATPPKAHENVLAQLPDGAAVILQKPMGRTLEAAQRIVELCRRKQLTAAVNFQFRFSPYMLAIKDLIQRGELGDIVDVECRLNLQTPWDTFPYLLEEKRVEILIHTVHYLDVIRHFLGEPRRVQARTVKHPKFPQFASTRSSIILDYGDLVRCCLSINHCHPFGPRHSGATLRVEGTEGCAVATLGLLIDYPRGLPDRLEVIGRSFPDWEEVPLRGGWFPDGFIGSMSNVQRFVAGEDGELVSPVTDALKTMKVVEACYVADAQGGIDPETLK